MDRKNSLEVSATAILIVGSIFLFCYALYNLREVRVLRTAISKSEANVLILQHRVAVAPAANPKIEPHAPADSRPTRDLRGLARDGAGSSPLGAVHGDSPLDVGQKFLAGSERARKLMDSVGRAQFSAAYESFSRSAHLSASQIKELENATMKVWQSSLAVVPGGLSPTLLNAPEDQLRSILGDEGYSAYQTYTLTLPARGIGDQIAIATGLAGTPITPEQSELLAQAISKNSPDFVDGNAVSINGVDWNSAVNGAKEILTPAQFNIAAQFFATLQYEQALARIQALPSAPDSSTQSHPE